MTADGSGDSAGRRFHAWVPVIASRDFPPLAATVEVEVTAQSRGGPGRAANTDNYLVVQLDRRFETLMTSFADPHVPSCYDEHGYALVVADGLGDGTVADVASRLTIASLAHLALYFGKWNLRIDEEVAREVMQRVDRFYRYIDTMLVQAGETVTMPVLQSSMTAALSAGDQLFIAHVGHSRAYLLRHGTLVQLTRDHTLASRRFGEPVLVDAPAIDGGHVVINAIGRHGHEPEIDIERVTLSDGDVVLLCTNGLSDALPEYRITDVLASDRFLDDQARTLVGRAFDEGATDDVTVVLARYEIPNGKAANGTGAAP